MGDAQASSAAIASLEEKLKAFEPHLSEEERRLLRSVFEAGAAALGRSGAEGSAGAPQPFGKFEPDDGPADTGPGDTRTDNPGNIGNPAPLPPE